MKANIPKSHPRYRSLIEREKLVEGYKKGLVVLEGLIAQGRGEAFDYIIGEKTIEPAEKALTAAAAMLLLAEKPVISVNGNVAALVPDDIVKLSYTLNCDIEVNLFYRTEERVKKIIEHLKQYGAKKVLGERTVEGVPGLESERRKISPEGILSADVVLVMIEDGDRTEHLKEMGKKVIAIDLNPFSRTALKADITIVDNVSRALPKLVEKINAMKNWRSEELEEVLKKYDNKKVLKEAIDYINKRLSAFTI
jgi:4-phosphopantoate--beta-alanine ligase